ncbi:MULTISPECIES: FitA-like ribbon-helix-helix domain-containing protein [Providencia]|uniref:FitA-like ribbon-helix-helix domain-containing protein n=1 Tax=Providencia TaxID=586 RepID=UPI00300D86D0
MRKILIRLIPEHVYEAIEKEAAMTERSMEGYIRYILNEHIQNKKNTSSNESYQFETMKRLNLIIQLANKVNSEKLFTPANIAEKLGHNNALISENWFIGNDPPNFSDLNNLSELFGCSSEWLKFGEGSPYPMALPRNIDTIDTEDLLSPYEEKYPVSCLHIIRLSNNTGNIRILREFKDTLITDFFDTSLCLNNDIQVDSDEFQNLLKFINILKKIHQHYIFNDCIVYSYLLNDSDFELHYKNGYNHPLYLINHYCQKVEWWKGIWKKETTNNNQHGDYYFWEGDKQLIELINK